MRVYYRSRRGGILYSPLALVALVMVAISAVGDNMTPGARWSVVVVGGLGWLYFVLMRWNDHRKHIEFSDGCKTCIKEADKQHDLEQAEIQRQRNLAARQALYARRSGVNPPRGQRLARDR